jgi:hypothetical protein
MSNAQTHTPEGFVPSLAMPTTFGSMTNRGVIASFEADNLSGEFRHPEHVRLAFAYLSEYPAIEALQRFSVALRRYAAVRGKPDRYHETITYAYLFIIRERMARTRRLDWDAFMEANPDLLEWKPGILDRYYRQSTLQSDLAREVFLFPDKIAEL